MSDFVLCTKCSTEKHPSEFYKKKGALQPKCKVCVNQYQKEARASWTPERREANKLYYREYNRRTAKKRNANRHGLTVEEYDQMIKDQNGSCAACKRELGELQHTGIDHDHKHCAGHTGCRECVRGVLCSNCNLALGHLKDDPDTLLMLYNYLTTRK